MSDGDFWVAAFADVFTVSLLLGLLSWGFGLGGFWYNFMSYLMVFVIFCSLACLVEELVG